MNNYRVISDYTTFNFSAKSHRLAIKHCEKMFNNFRLYIKQYNDKDFKLFLIYNTKGSLWRKICLKLAFWR